jgi:phosphoribosylaminoimidazole-succinocarboxamide synthase
MKIELERKGSSKDIYNVCHNDGSLRCIRFHFSDRVSVLDLGGIPGTAFPGLGRLRCAISGHLFRRMNSAGFRTHYISHDVENATMDVHPFDIKELNVSYEGVKSGRILGIEIIDRRMATKKLIGRVDDGTLARKRLWPSLGDRHLAPNVRLSPPFVECTTKYQDADRYITDEEAAALAGVRIGWLYAYCYPEVQKASEFLFNLFRDKGFDRHDGKFEGAIRYSGGTFIFADSISPDEMRLVGSDGLSYDKDPVRQWYQETFPDWYAEVLKAKAEHPTDRSKWPSYPAETPPAEVVNEVVRRYEVVAKALGAI